MINDLALLLFLTGDADADFLLLMLLTVGAMSLNMFVIASAGPADFALFFVTAFIAVLTGASAITSENATLPFGAFFGIGISILRPLLLGDAPLFCRWILSSGMSFPLIDLDLGIDLSSSLVTDLPLVSDSDLPLAAAAAEGLGWVCEGLAGAFEGLGVATLGVAALGVTGTGGGAALGVFGFALALAFFPPPPWSSSARLVPPAVIERSSA